MKFNTYQAPEAELLSLEASLILCMSGDAEDFGNQEDISSEFIFE